jgi:hypothetical protein
MDSPTFRRESVLSDFNAEDYPRRSLHVLSCCAVSLHVSCGPCNVKPMGVRGCYLYEEGLAALLAFIALLIRDTVDILQGIAPADACEPNLPQNTKCIQPSLCHDRSTRW